MAANIGDNHVAADQLRQFIERVEMQAILSTYMAALGLEE